MNALKKKFLLSLAVHLMMVVAARGQVGGKITGSVKDPSGSVVAGANVALINIQTGVKLTAVTGQDARHWDRRPAQVTATRVNAFAR